MIYIDIENNSLEDAYINIAKEEEKLLEQLKSGRRSSQILPSVNNPDSEIGTEESNNKKDSDLEYEMDLKRYMETQASPNIFRQSFANLKRRLLQFIKSPR